MKNISDWIDKIIDDLVNPEKKLSDTLLKVQVLAFKIENEKLKEWTNLELHGYAGKVRPDYRKIPCAAQGNLIQNAGFQGVFTRNNSNLPVEYLDKKYWESLMSIKLDSSVSELEKMVETSGSYQVNIPHALYSQFNKILFPWVVDSAWLKINLNSVEGILSIIKSTLLNFLLELNKEFGDNDNLSIMKKEREVGKIFDNTIGSIQGESINISIGDKSAQSVNYGEKSNINVGAGDSINQILNTEQKEQIQDFVKLLKANLENLGLDKEANEDIQNEISRVEAQLKRESPKKTILESALGTINGVLTGIAANAYTPIVLEKLSEIMPIF